MIIAKKDLKKVYTLFFKAGVFVCKKDPKKKHKETGLEGRAIYKIMKSLRSRGLIEEQFNWQYYYWRLNNEGIEYLREYLHFPKEVVPDTYKPRKRRTPLRDQRRGGRGRGRGRGRSFRGRGRGRGFRGGRGRGFFGDKKMGPSDSFRPRFSGGRGRGRGYRGRGYRERGEQRDGGYRPRNFGGRGQQRYNQQQQTEEKN
ncbi:ribosomal protein S10 [Anaeramoeba flamelloides]|uniref:Ribosomal protein S10 n=1 Tax=Anaeramoeba flamelloides TaxID=1746091 RepID=A0AAV7YWA1_9EUKA|nr:ribosomal protein S10 [Anaeramoeba flamelloides]